MKYTLLIRPHDNSRYQQSAMPLAHAELFCMLRREGLLPCVEESFRFSARWLDFEADELDEATLGRLSTHSQLEMLFVRREDGSLLPLAGPMEAFLGADLPSVQKYKGKTNERFTRHLINMALLSSRFSGGDRLRLLDPMCGRGTTLFEALNRGWDAVGADLAAGDVAECGRFFKKYLEYHRLKHQLRRGSLTLNGRGLSTEEFSFARDAETMKQGGERTLTLLSADAAELDKALKKQKFHLIVADLPYGVQHAPGEAGNRKAGFTPVLEKCLSAWSGMLLPGGAAALSFNVNTLPLETVRGAMERAGLTVMRGEGYEGLSHWVEQAITRDLAVAVKE